MNYYSVELIPTKEPYADEITSNANNWLKSCIGICETSPEKAMLKAENELGDAFKDEVDVYYTISVIEIDLTE